jgi:SAM-dependent methyltransferase
MENPFDTQEMAAGYATSRPPVHPRVLEQVYRNLGRSEPFHVALDVGCGAGVSTRALDGFARRCVGLEPVEAMLKWASTTAPSAAFVAGAAEAIPLRDGSVDLITAAGSLNYADLDLFFPDAARVLTANGILVVYDFSPGRTFRDARGLDDWFSIFHHRYLPPSQEGRDLSPEILAEIALGFRLHIHRAFEIGVPLTLTSYVNYVMTETNVAAAVRRGVAHAEIKSWCAETLAPLWNTFEREVLFRGYFACMCPA